MLDILKFVQGAVAKKDYAPALTHFRIHNGIIKGFNGRMALCGPIALDLDVTPKAIPFAKAISACKDTVQLSMTGAGRLAVKSGAFKAYIDCADNEQYPELEPEGDEVVLNGTFLDVLRRLEPFIAEDASRPWACGILLRGDSAYATNNIVLVEHWLGFAFPIEINIPKEAVKELLRIKEEPSHLQVTKSSVTFHYTNKRWLRTQLFSIGWPDMHPVLDAVSEQKHFPAGFFSALNDLSPFLEDAERIFIEEGKLLTSQSDGSGASVIVEGIVGSSCFSHKHLMTLATVAATIDFSRFPKPCIFYGENLRGAIVGMRS